jgi:hypothetical protein
LQANTPDQSPLNVLHSSTSELLVSSAYRHIKGLWTPRSLLLHDQLPHTLKCAGNLVRKSTPLLHKQTPGAPTQPSPLGPQTHGGCLTVMPRWGLSFICDTSGFCAYSSKPFTPQYLTYLPPLWQAFQWHSVDICHIRCMAWKNSSIWNLIFYHLR